MVIRWLIQIWLLRLLAVEDFGEVAVAISFGTLLMMLAEFGTGQAVVQREHVDDEFLSTVFWLNVGIGCALFIAVWGGSRFVAHLQGASTLTDILPVMALSFTILSASIVQRSLIIRSLEFGKIALLSIADSVAYGAVAISLALSGYGVWALVLGFGAGSVAAATATWLLNGWIPRLLFRWAVIREIWSFSINILGARVADHVFLEADRVVIYTMVGPKATGFYFAAQQLVIFPIATVTQILAAVLVPALARLQEDLPAFRRLLTRSLAGVVFIIAPMLLGLAAVLSPTISGFLNDAGTEGQKWAPALALALVLVPASFVRSLFITTASVYVAMGRTQLMFRWTLVLGVSLIVSYLAGAAIAGVIGVAAAYSLTHLLLAPKLLQTAIGLVDLRVKVVARVMVPSLFLAIAMAGMVLFTVALLRSAGLRDELVVVVGIAVGGLLYCVGAIAVRPPGSEDLMRLAGLGALLRPTRTGAA